MCDKFPFASHAAPFIPVFQLDLIASCPSSADHQEAFIRTSHPLPTGVNEVRWCKLIVSWSLSPKEAEDMAKKASPVQDQRGRSADYL